MGRWSYAIFYAHMATGMLLGFLIGRRGWIRRIDEWRPRIPRVQWTALALSLAASLSSVAALQAAPGVEPAPMWVFGAGFAHATSRLALMAFYVLTVVRLAGVPAWRRVLQPFALAGRMPLTNYLLQTALGIFVFYGWGLGWWNRVGPAIELALATLLFVAIQLPLSAWWLHRFRYGPIEYVWRRLSYGNSIG
jgi:uncharacterized protein